MTIFQKITLGLVFAYLIWEVIVFFWSKQEEGPIIRADLILIYPILAIFILISLIQWLRKRKG